MVEAGIQFPPIEFQLDPARTALLVVDVQYWSAHPDGGNLKPILAYRPGSLDYFYSRLKKTTIPAIQRLLRLFRDNSLRVVYLTIGRWAEDGSDLNPVTRFRNAFRDRFAGTTSESLCMVGTPQHRVLDEIRPLPNELVVNKNTSDAFASSNLDTLLKNMGIQYLVITGVVTNGCVESTARSAADHGYFSILVDDGCAAYAPDAHEATLKCFCNHYGMVKTSEEVIRLLAPRPARPPVRA